MLQLFKAPVGSVALFLNGIELTTADPSPANVKKAETLAEKIASASGVNLEIVHLQHNPDSWDSVVTK